MTNFTILFISLLGGILGRLSGRFPVDFHKAINAVIINLVMPAVVFRNVWAMTFDRQMLVVALVPWAIFAVAIAIFVAIGRARDWSRETIGALAVTAGYGNSSFLGVPLIEAVYGVPAMSIGVLGAEAGVNLSTSTAGLLTAAWFGSGTRVQAIDIARRIAFFPPFQAFVLGLLLHGIALPAPLVAVLDRFGVLLAPLAMLSIGYQMHIDDWKGLEDVLATALAVKFIVAPLVALSIVMALGMRGTVAEVIVFHASMPPQISGAIIAADFKLDARAAASVVGFGLCLVALAAPFWYFVGRALLGA